MLKGTLRACGNWVTLWDLVMLNSLPGLRSSPPLSQS
jgi:hypothetical protein